MKVAIIGASYLQLPVYLKAKEMGIQTIGFSWPEGAVARNFCDRFYPISIIEKDLILKICRNEKIQGILSIASDVAVPTVNYIASKMDLVGNSIESSINSTNKYLMRERLKRSGLLCPNYLLIKENCDLIEIEKKIHYPAIVKPVDRSGSIGVTKVINSGEFENAVLTALKASFSSQAIVEDFIDGVEVSFEIVSFNGIHYGLTITDKETSGAPHFVELAHHQPSQIHKNIQIEIFETAKKGLDALEIRNGASHPEFIISSKGIFITEIGARMGGDFIGSDLVYLSTGYDFLKGVIHLACGDFDIPQKVWEKCSGVYFYSDKTINVEEFIDKGDQSLIIRSEIYTKELLPLKQSSDRGGYFIYQANKPLRI